MKAKLFLLVLIGLLVPLVSATDIFCNDYEFSCCDLSTIGSYTATETKGFICQYDKCTITDYWDSRPYTKSGYVIGSGACGWKNEWYTTEYYDCAVKRGPFYDANHDMVKGEVAFINPEKESQDFLGEYPYPNFKVERFSNRVMFCGDAACSASNTGAPIQESQGCSFIPQGSVYSTSGTKTASSGASYTVPVKSCSLSWSGKRFVCGNTEESCTVNSDCSGHTYGTQECYGRTLQTYGCVSFGSVPTQSEIDVLPFESTPKLGYGKRCEAISAKTVQCCGDTDCGSSAFCDKSTWTCQTSASCRQDSDCGVSQVCDREKKQLKSPECSAGKCGYEVVKSVECCFNEDCPEGNVCGTDYKCVKKQDVIGDCPFQCCVKNQDPYYFERPCDSGKVCCGDHVCADNENKCAVAPGITDKAKCEAAGGKWVEVIQEAPWWKFWEGDKIASYCRISHTPEMAIILLVAGGIGTAVTFYFGMIPLTYISAVVGIISLIWLILARGGMI